MYSKENFDSELLQYKEGFCCSPFIDHQRDVIAYVLCANATCNTNYDDNRKYNTLIQYNEFVIVALTHLAVSGEQLVYHAYQMHSDTYNKTKNNEKQ